MIGSVGEVRVMVHVGTVKSAVEDDTIEHVVVFGFNPIDGFRTRSSWVTSTSVQPTVSGVEGGSWDFSSVARVFEHCVVGSGVFSIGILFFGESSESRAVSSSAHNWAGTQAANSFSRVRIVFISISSRLRIVARTRITSRRSAITSHNFLPISSIKSWVIATVSL